MPEPRNIGEWLWGKLTPNEKADYEAAVIAEREARDALATQAAIARQNHWPEACTEKCHCGKLCCYDAYFWHGLFLCRTHYDEYKKEHGTY